MKPFTIEESPHGLTDVPGFEASGISCDVREQGKRGRLDVAMVRSREPAVVSGVFTQHAFAAAPVRLCREVLGHSRTLHGLVVNSGNANACTGITGEHDAREMQSLGAVACGVEPAQMLVCSTGRIGRRLPMDRLREGIAMAGEGLSTDAESGLNAARAILTSDTREKLVTVRIPTESGEITIAGMAKGAGMIEPNMATMLAFLTTDAQLTVEEADFLLREAVGESFNAITVDGDQSTNDTVLLLANGASGVGIALDGGAGVDREVFAAALGYACAVLAGKIVSDGEKITKVVEVRVEGAARREEAEAVARAIGNSLLVKSSWFGNDPNWGRLLGAAGYASATYDPDRVRLYYQPWYEDESEEPIPVFLDGEPQHEHLPRWREMVARPHFAILLNLRAGDAHFRLLASDLTDGYVQFNKSE